MATAAALAVEGVSPLTAGGKRKAAEALLPRDVNVSGDAAGSKLAAPAVAAATKPEKKQMGLMSFFSKKAAA